MSVAASEALPLATENRRGILAMLAAMALFTLSDSLVKLMAAHLPPGQIMATRGVFSVVLTLAIVLASGEARSLPNAARGRVAIRALIEGGSVFAYFTAIAHLPLGNLTAILQTTPLMLTVLVAVLGIERVGSRRFAAILVGFAGVLLVVKPSASGVNLYSALALVSAILVCCRDFVTRAIAGHIPGSVVTLATNAVVTAVGFMLCLVEAWQVLSVRETLVLAAAALFVTLGNLAIVKAFRIGEMAVVSPFRYSIILTSLAAGFVVFGEVPDAVSIAGIVLIVGSGIYTLHREQVRRREAALRAGTPA